MIIYLYGPDTYRSTQKLNQLKEKFTKEIDPSKLNLAVFDNNKISIDEIRKELSAMPFMAKKRMIILKNLITQKNSELQKLLDEHLEKETDSIIIIFEEGMPDGRTKKIAKLKKSKFSQEFQLLDAIGLTQFIITEIRKRGGIISSQTANYISSVLDNDLWHVSQEINKLIGYAGTEEITKKDVDLLVQAKFDDNIFKLIDSIATKNKAVALQLLEDQFAIGNNEMYLLSMIIRQFRIMIQIKDLLESNPHLREGDIAKILAVHPFVAKKSLSQVQKFTMDYLKAIYKYLVSLDKGFKNSYAEPRLLLDTFIAKI